MKKTFAIAAVAATMMTAAIPAKANDFPLGPILGGIAGGFIGNQFGRGTGNTVATAMGAVGGVLLGQGLQSPHAPHVTHGHGYPNYRYRNRHRPYTRGAPRCGMYSNPAARAQCNRGVADRLRAYQREVERQAYMVGRGTYNANPFGIGQKIRW